MSQFSDERSGLIICAWCDNCRVLTISNYLRKDLISDANRYDQSQRKKIIIKRPASVELYNQFMGGVDKANMYLPLYRSKFRSRKWYHRIVTHFFNLAVVNSYVLYKELGGNGPLVDFLSNICRCLMAVVDFPDNHNDEIPRIAKKVRSVRANDVPDAIRLDKPLADTRYDPTTL